MIQPLDEDLLNEITYSPECQATFKKYKGKLIWTILINSLIVIGVVGFIFRNFSSTFEFLENTHAPDLMFFLFFALMLFLVYHGFFALKSVLYSIKDLIKNKLDVRPDIFVKAVVKQTSNGTKYFGLFQEQGEVAVPAFSISTLKKETKVYIIRAAYSKTLLDIVLGDKFGK